MPAPALHEHSDEEQHQSADQKGRDYCVRQNADVRVVNSRDVGEDQENDVGQTDRGDDQASGADDVAGQARPVRIRHVVPPDRAGSSRSGSLAIAVENVPGNAIASHFVVFESVLVLKLLFIHLAVEPCPVERV